MASSLPLALLHCCRCQGIFVPFFGYIWMDAKAELEAVSSKAQQLQQSQKRKKKSRASTSPLDESTQGLLVEMRTMVEFLVMAFNECFNSDVDGFTDKARYDAIMPALVSAVAIRPVFASDEQHVAFVKDRLAPCVASMAQCVGKDVMWKPMNHQVLMFTRDDSATVKLAAIHVIYKLFVEVGTLACPLACRVLPTTKASRSTTHVSWLFLDSRRRVPYFAARVLALPFRAAGRQRRRSDFAYLGGTFTASLLCSSLSLIACCLLVFVCVFLPR